MSSMALAVTCNGILASQTLLLGSLKCNVCNMQLMLRDAVQVYSVGLYLAGLIGFAVLLALVEQSVLGVYEARVELGAPVLEAGHMLVLAWCR